jgi:prepilin-type N-terminal cleavage/methylation domain-containing protein/prepilin-type processing-associated H-X9-DG protein
MNGKKQRAEGFTLIELLIVIALIGIIAAILFPVFARVRESARRSSCQSNLKQIGLGIAQYVQDNDERMPFIFQDYRTTGYKGLGSNYQYQTWSSEIYPYVKSTQLFFCPSDSESRKKTNANMSSQYFKEISGDDTAGMIQSYGGNAMYINPSSTPLLAPFSSYRGGNPGDFSSYYMQVRNVASIEAPTTTVLVTEVLWSDAATYGGYKVTSLSSLDTSKSPPQLGNVVARHLETTNVLFCDGHVKAMNLQTLSAKSVAGNFKYFTTSDD